MERYLCDTCLYTNNCQFIAKYKEGATGCSAYINTYGVSVDRIREICAAERDGRLVVLPCKVEQLKAQYDKLTEQMGDEAETYTTGYRNGHKNGQAEMIAYLLQLDIGTRAEAEAALDKQKGD
jgi:hypothetical protein